MKKQVSCQPQQQREIIAPQGFLVLERIARLKRIVTLVRHFASALTVTIHFIVIFYYIF